MTDGQIPDSEVLFRRIPPTASRFQPPDRVSSGNYVLAPDESGLSVYRATIVSAEEVLDKPGVKPGSGITQATAGQIRSLRNAANEPLHLNVIVVDDEDDPGHAEIRTLDGGRISKSAAKALKDVFQIARAPSPQ